MMILPLNSLFAESEETSQYRAPDFERDAHRANSPLYHAEFLVFERAGGTFPDPTSQERGTPPS